jgi:uncharacterized membrane protein YuzA (DUF378 family)
MNAALAKTWYIVKGIAGTYEILLIDRIADLEETEIAERWGIDTSLATKLALSP